MLTAMKARLLRTRKMRGAIAIAGAATALVLGGASVPAQAATARCPRSGSVCFYGSPGYTNYLDSVPQTSCDGHLIPLPDRARNKIESIRNRTGCYVNMYENIGRGQTCVESIQGHREADRVHDPDQYDWYSFSRNPKC